MVTTRRQSLSAAKKAEEQVGARSSGVSGACCVARASRWRRADGSAGGTGRRTPSAYRRPG